MRDKKLIFFLILSLMIHILVMTIVHRKKLPSPDSEKTVTIELVEPTPIVQKAKDKRQIVEQNEQAINDEIPEDAKYLSLHNQKVIKETKARDHGKFKNEIGGNARPAAREKVSQPDEFGTKKKSNLLSKLTPGYQWPKSNAVGPATTDDYLKDVNDGGQTLLSTREFVYYTYYRRIKNQLAQYWEPKIKDKVTKLFKQGRNIANTGDKITRLVITLNAKGILTRVQVMGESGVKDLDDAAIEAFRAAAPFPNPPHGIVEKDGNIRITWDFVLEV